MAKKILFTVIAFGIVFYLTSASAKTGYVDIPVNSIQQVTTMSGVGLPPSYGGTGEFHAVFKIFPVVPGKRYEATLTYHAGDNIGYGISFGDGDPSVRDSVSFVGIGHGTGSRVMKDKEEKFLFSISPQSTSNVLYVVVGSHRPLNIRFSVTDRPSGVTKESKDRWGYFYVTDFHDRGTAPFLLKRGGYVAAQAMATGAPAVRIFGPYAFLAGQFSGTIKLAQISENEGIIWLKIDGYNVEEILNAVIRGSELKFVRTIDCRFNAPRTHAQVFTGQIAPDGTFSGSYFNDYESVLIYPWQAQKR
ncbi:MAG: hypothetical protein FJ139_05195 [Deltaproteobacteria bacterium]|nr:hypothetical protein [Deltaproteobacteria bacterium]